MRGGVTYEEAMQMSSAERAIIDDIVKENLATKPGLSYILLYQFFGVGPLNKLKV